MLVAFFRVNLLGELVYRVNFLWQLFESLINLGVSLAGLGIIFSYTGSIGGWRPEEVLALVGVYLLMGGVIGFIIQPGMEELISDVTHGTLDYTLVKPGDAQLLVSLQQIGIWKLIDLMMGLGVLITAVVILGHAIGLEQAVVFILLLLAGALTIYSFWLMLATLSFWFVRVENVLLIFQSMYEAGRWPVSLYPGWFRYALTFAVPVAFATLVPAEALTGRLTWTTLLEAVIFALALLALARLLWRAGLRHYTGTSA